MKSYVFQVVIEDDTMENGEKAYHAYCPALKGCHTWGRSYDEALANIREAVELYVEDMRDSGVRIPADPEHGGLEWPTPAVAVNIRPMRHAVSRYASLSQPDTPMVAPWPERSEYRMGE